MKDPAGSSQLRALMAPLSQAALTICGRTPVPAAVCAMIIGICHHECSMTSSFSPACIWQHAGANRTRTSVMPERRIALALKKRGIERSLLQHDVLC